MTATSTPDLQPPQTQTWGTCNNAGHIPQVVYGTPSLYGTGGWSACGSGPYKDFTITGSSQSYGLFLLRTYSQTNCSPCTRVFLPCFTFSGSYTLTMTRLEADLVLTPSATTILAGAAATFQWAATPDSLAGQATPVVVRRTFFEPDSTGGGVPSDSTKTCAISGASCTIQPLGSGTLHLWAFVNGKLVHKTAHVTVVKCATGDTLLDQPNIRTDLLNMMRLSNPDSAPGTGMDSTHLRGAKREHALWIYRRDDSTFFSVPVPDSLSGSDECSIQGTWPAPPDPPNARLWAISHSHPGDDQRPAYGDCSAIDPSTGKISPCQRYPGDANGVACYKKDDYSIGGGSEPDWDLTKRGVDIYTMNKQGEIWRLPAYTPARDRLRDRSKRRKQWKGNPNPACDW